MSGKRALVGVFKVLPVLCCVAALAITGGLPFHPIMNGGIAFSPYTLLSRSIVTEGSTYGNKIIKLVIALPDKNTTLGFGQPSTAVKILPPGAWIPKGKAYSIASPPDMKGKFELLVKVYPNGQVSSYLDSVPVGESIYCARAITKPVRPPEQVKRLGLIAYGIGISDVLHTSKKYLDEGAAVRLIYAVKGKEDAIMTEDLDILAKLYSNKFYVRYQLSREPDAPTYGKEWYHGRLSEDVLREVFSDWVSDDSMLATTATDVIGTKQMMKSTFAMLDSIGLTRRLIGPKGPAGWFWK
eukprot:m.12638 g.12638  ORF g.12638 m.12638 type:complete len:297 (+) comp4698_c0_seq1:99-989(+)